MLLDERVGRNLLLLPDCNVAASELSHSFKSLKLRLLLVVLEAEDARWEVKGVFGVFSEFLVGDSLPARPRDLTGLPSRLREPDAETRRSQSHSESSSSRLSWLELPDFFIVSIPD